MFCELKLRKQDNWSYRSVARKVSCSGHGVLMYESFG